ncbi:PAS domain-containing protein [Methanomicrobium sp. W14]|uniref:PAS domain-containing protein n=1 Tax=Methanomicrobium sp. W14 TaxID=2817839 RepID=UPI001AEAC941|nr:PAS domain-containing protein [Methanomicrobium sp. W14]MBP2134302.1 PAS domain-containing protein [Methanomicrobium sp. W14]
MSGLFSPGPFKAKKSVEIFREAFFKNPVGICILTHPDFRIKIVNESFAEVFGLEKSGISGKLFTAVWKKDPLRDEFFSLMREKGLVKNFKLCLFSPSGKGELQILLSSAFIDDENIIISAVNAENSG